jgi:hypothetical protein
VECRRPHLAWQVECRHRQQVAVYPRQQEGFPLPWLGEYHREAVYQRQQVVCRRQRAALQEAYRTRLPLP